MRHLMDLRAWKIVQPQLSLNLAHLGIHPAVDGFVSRSGIAPDAWLQLLIDDSIRNINEHYALGCANQVAQTVRQLNAQGVSDIHLFTC